MRTKFKKADDLLKNEKMICNYDADMTAEDRYTGLECLEHYLGTMEMTNENPSCIPAHIFFSSFPGLTHRQVYTLLDREGCTDLKNDWSKDMYEYGYLFKHEFKVRSIEWECTKTKVITYVTPVGRTFFKQLLEFASRDILTK